MTASVDNFARWRAAERVAKGLPAQPTERATFKIFKVNQPQRIVYGWGNVCVDSTGLVTDRQDDQIEPDVLEAAVVEFMLEYRDSGVMHEGDAIAKVVASLVTTPDIIKAFFSDVISADLLAKIPIGWIVGVKVLNDAAWQDVLDDKLTAFSIQGSADRVPAQAAA